MSESSKKTSLSLYSNDCVGESGKKHAAHTLYYMKVQAAGGVWQGCLCCLFHDYLLAAHDVEALLSFRYADALQVVEVTVGHL